MLCDYLGAGRAYYGKDFTFEKEFEWWKSKLGKPCATHPNDKTFINKYMELLHTSNNTKEVFDILRKEK